jgi:hypothetical protein
MKKIAITLTTVLLIMAACTPAYAPYDGVIEAEVSGQKGRTLSVRNAVLKEGNDGMTPAGEIDLSLVTYNPRFDHKSPQEFTKGATYRFYVKRLKKADLDIGVVLAERVEARIEIESLKAQPSPSASR